MPRAWPASWPIPTRSTPHAPELEPVLADVASAWFDAVAHEALAPYDVTYRHDAAAIAAMVAAGDVDAAILLPPVTVEQIRAAADARVRMPQKTTFFAPEAAYRPRVPHPRRLTGPLRPRPVSAARCQATSQTPADSISARRSPGPRVACAAPSWLCTSAS